MSNSDLQARTEKKKSREKDANCFSRFFFLWVSSLVSLAAKRVIEEEDIFDIPSASEVESLTTVFTSLWNPANASPKDLEQGRYLWKVGKKQFRHRYFWLILLFSSTTFSQCVYPLLLREFVNWFMDPLAENWVGWATGGGMLAANLLQIMCSNHAILGFYTIGMDCRTLLNTLVYQKALSMTQKARAQTTVGQVVSLMSADSQRIPMAFVGLNSLFTAPVSLAFGVICLLWLTGWPGLIALVLMLITLPLPVKIGMFQGKLVMRQAAACDTRVKTVNEGLQGIRVLKYYAWDLVYAELVRGQRLQEMGHIRHLAWAQASQLTIMDILPCLIAVCMSCAWYLNDPAAFTPANAFTALSLLNLIRFPLAMLPMGIKSYVDLQSTCIRLQRYLLLEDRPDANRGADAKDISDTDTEQCHVAVKGGSFVWEISEPIDLGAKGKGKGGKQKKEKTKKKRKGADQSTGKSTGDANGQVVDLESPAVRDANGQGGASVSLSMESPAKDKELNFELSDISLVGNAGQLLSIVGKVGSGKSSLLNAILSEMPKRSGEVILRGSVAYCSQVPWIQSATLRDNILFNGPLDVERYDEVIDMCALAPDCEALPGGDLTEIGEKGVNLSGGQKARVALARACYQRADIYLLDDVLSAVDSETGSWIFEKCIKVLLERKCLVVLATNATHFLQHTDAVYVLRNGTIAEQGSFDELREKDGGVLNEMLSVAATEEPTSTASPTKAGDVSSEPSEKLVTRVSRPRWSVSSRTSVLSAGSEGDGALTQKELRAQGTVSWKVWYYYFWTCPGPFIPAFVVLMAIVGQAAKNLFEWWVSYWSTQVIVSPGKHDDAFYIAMYGLIGVAAAVFGLFRSVSASEMITRNARVMHEQLLKSIMLAPMSFFDTTPNGRVMNRFSKDMNAMDIELQRTLPAFLFMITAICGQMVTIGISLPFFFIALVPLAIFYWDVGRRFRPLSRDIQRLESTSRSPLFAKFSETLYGTTTIRAFGQVKRFHSQSTQIINASNRAFYTMHNANRWLGLRLELVGFLILLSVIGLVIEARGSGRVNPGLVGLALFYAMQVTQLLNFAIRMMTETEAKMTSCERIYEYTSQITPESAVEKVQVASKPPPPSWPDKGHIEFSSVVMRYRPNLPEIIKDVSFVIEGSSKVGICGRTGSGKSTLFNILFRMVDIYNADNQCSGCIKIDGVDVGELRLKDLRRGLAIIPQDAVMFAGTVRENLDLISAESNDEDIWAALRQASLEDVVKNMSGGLDAKVQEGGENFSCGQRQLVCLARALLRQSKIICLDEATANIDVKTDAIIQQVMKTEFADNTVLTIAHRLNTIATHDRILVLDAGQVAEYDTPAELLKKGEDGIFWSLVQEMGEGPAAELTKEVFGGQEAPDTVRENQILTI